VLNDAVGASGPLGLNGLVDMLTFGSGALSLNESHLPALPSVWVPLLGNVTLSVRSLKVAGLDSLSEVAALTPVRGDKAALRSEVAMGRVNLSMALRVTSSLRSAPIDLGVATSVEAVRLALQGRLAFNSSALSVLALDQLPHGACWARMVLQGAVQALEMEAGSVAVAVSGNEWGQSARSITARMGPMRGGSLPVGVSNLIGALVNPLIDLKLHEVQAGSCPSAEWPSPPPPPSADAQDWNQSQIIKAVDFVLNDALGPKRFNEAAYLLTRGSGSLFLIEPTDHVNFPMRLPIIGQLNMTVSSLEISGLDTAEKLSLLTPVIGDKAALLSEVGMGRVNVSVTLIAVGDFLASPVEMGLGIAVEQVELGLQGRLGVNSTGLSELQIAQVVNSSSCILRSLIEASVQAVHASAAGVSLSVVGNDWGALGSSVMTTSRTMRFELPLPRVISSVLDTMVNPLLAYKLDALHRDFCQPAFAVSNTSRAPPLPIATLQPVKRLRQYINDKVGWQGIDRAVDAYDAKRQKPAGRFDFPFPITLPTIHDEKLGTINVRLSGIHLDGLDELFALDMMEGDADDYTLLHHTIGFGSPNPVSLSVMLDLQLDDQWHSFSVLASMAGLQLNLGTVLDIDGSLAIEPLLTQVWSNPACAALPVRNFSLSRDGSTNVKLNGSLELKMSSPHVQLPADVVGAYFPVYMSSIGAGLIHVLDDKSTAFFDRLHASCSAPPSPPPLGNDDALDIILILVITVAVMLGICCCVFVRRRQLRKRNRMLLAPQLDTALITNDEREPALESEPSLAMLHSRRIRICYTTALLVTTGTFVWANAKPGARVDVLLELAGEHVALPPLFKFTLMNSVEDMWNAKAYPLALLIALMSGIWPYIKLVMMGACWWLPPAILPISRRDLMVRILDASGKWCIVDTQMLVMMMVAFHFDIVMGKPMNGTDVSSNNGTEVPPLVNARVETTPDLGVWLYILSTIFSLCLTHLEVHLHRGALRARHLAACSSSLTPTPRLQSDRREQQSAPADSAETGRICNVNDFGGRAGTGVVLLRRATFRKLACFRGRALPSTVQHAVPLILALCFAGILYASFCAYVFTLHIEGLTGALLGKDDDHVSLSVWSMASQIVGITTLGVPVLMWMLQIFFITTTLITPLGFLAICAFLWLAPMSRRCFHNTIVIAEVTYAWAMLDVFAVMVVVALLELNQFAQFIMGDELNGINAILQEYEEFHPYLPEQNVAFGITPSLESGYWMLAAFVFVANPVGLFVIHAAIETEHAIDTAEMTQSSSTAKAHWSDGTAGCSENSSSSADAQ